MESLQQTAKLAPTQRDVARSRRWPADPSTSSTYGGHVEDIPTQHCVLWRDEESMLKDVPRNMLATFLWWKLCPPVAERAVLRGTVFVTGSAEGEWCEPVLDEVVELFERIEQICRETAGAFERGVGCRRRPRLPADGRGGRAAQAGG